MVAQGLYLFLCSAKWKAKRDSRDHQVAKEAESVVSLFQMFCRGSGEHPRLIVYFSELLGLFILQLTITIGKQRDPDEGAQVWGIATWTMGHNFIPRSTVSSSWASTWQESWHILKPTTRDSKEVLLMNTIWGIWIRGTVSSPGPVHLSLHSLLLLLIKETTIVQL